MPIFLLRLIWAVVRALFASRADLVSENLALRLQLIGLHRKTNLPRLKTKDRVFWLWLARSWRGWRKSLIVVKPATVVRWHRQGFSTTGPGRADTKVAGQRSLRRFAI